MANSIQKYATILQERLDQQVARGATSGWMEQNAGQVIYNGGKKIEIGTISTQGLADYDREDGFTKGAISLVYNTYEMTQDRGRTFSIDRMDNDDTHFHLNATAAMAEFQKRHVIPEIDAYRYSKLATLAITASQTTSDYTPAAATIAQQLLEDLGAIEDIYGEEVTIVISMPGSVKRILEQSTFWNRSASIIEFDRGGVKTKVHAINDHPIIPVPSARMKTKYTFYDGETEGQEAGGFVVHADALDINWLLTVKTDPIAISKTDKIRIFAPDINQMADAWKLDYRKYHDLWVKKQHEVGLFVNTAPVPEPETPESPDPDPDPPAGEG